MSARLFLSVSLFGLVRVECDNHPMVLPTRKTQALLAFLVLHPESHPREKLAALFWGDATGEQALHSLRTALNALHKALGEIFVADRETVQLNPDYALQVDVREFETAVRENPSSAVNLYQGDLLTEFYDDWILQERERVRALYLDALLHLVQNHRAKSEYAKAIAFAQRTLASDAANEAAHQHLMFCYLASGNRTAALAQYEKCAQALQQELNVAPSPETKALYAQIQIAPSESGAARVTNLPNPLTSFIGREKEINEIKECVDTARLVTLTGAGGCGKTRLAIQVARELSNANDFAHGVWFVELAPLTDATLIAQTVASVLGLREEPGRPILDGLKYFLRSKQLLLLLDNCEHLIDACAQLADTLLQDAPQLKILATSREALGIAGETIFLVPSLTMPAPAETSPETLTQAEAAHLFVMRAAAAQPSFQVTEQNAHSIAQICVRLDGIPLALELAAARVKALTVQEVAAHLDDRFRLLTGGSRTALPRQRTLQATMDWSYRLLSEAERLLLQRLSVFSGGWTLDAAEAVCADDALPRAEILDLLLHLVEKSLVVAETRATETRYRMLETIRQYASEKLDETNQALIVRDKHLDFFAELTAQMERKMRSAAHQTALERLDAEYDNIRAAIQWSLTSDVQKGLRIGANMRQYWRRRGLIQEGLQQLLALVSDTNAQAPTLARAMALTAGAWMYPSPSTRTEDLQLFLQEALTIVETHGDSFGIACALSVQLFGEEYARAGTVLEKCLGIYRTLNEKWFCALMLSRLGTIASYANDPESARTLLQEALDVARAIGDSWLIAWTLRRMGDAAQMRIEPNAARLFLQEGLALFRTIQDPQGTVWSLNSLGECARMERKYQDALSYYDQAQRGYQQLFGFPAGFISANQAFVAIHLADLNLAETCAKLAIPFNPVANESNLLLALTAFAFVAIKRSAYERAAQLMGYMETRGQALGLIWEAADEMDHAEILEAIHSAPDQEAIQAAWARGAAMIKEEAIALALSDNG